MSEAATAHVAHHFENLDQQREAMTLGMWVFLATEIMFFGGLFLAYVVYRSRFPLGFAEGSHHLDFWLGTINTGLLLVSSYTVVLALNAAQSGRGAALVICLLLTIALGSGFLGIKAYEYWHKYHEHHVPGARFELKDPHYKEVEPRHVEMFYCLYFAMTGLHAAHMVIGIGVFVVITTLAWRKRIGRNNYMSVELAGLYWHFVDIIWVFLYPMLYMVG